MLTTQSLQRTPLYEEHLALGARMVPFGGWEMPVQYEGILAEHKHTREAVTVFDTCHMGEFTIHGEPGKVGLDRLVTMNLQTMPYKTCRYGFLLNEKGGVMDDLIVFRIDEEKWFIVVNGATTLKDADHFRRHLKEKEAFEDISAKTGKIDIQGPLARNILKSLVDGIEKLDYYTFDFFDLLGENVLISRTGYTGELGYEIFYPWQKIKELWRVLLENGKVKPAGLGARDMLRLEVGYCLYGHELDEHISPLEAGLEKFIDFEKDFIGKKALLEQKKQEIPHRLIGVASASRRAPRLGQKIYSLDGKEIGSITSGSFSPMVGIGVGLGFVKIEAAAKGTAILFGNEKLKSEGEITSRIFYRNGSLKN